MIDKTAMRTTSGSHFDADSVGRLVSKGDGRRFEMEFRDATGRNIVVSVPFSIAVELGCMICAASEVAPYLVGGVRTARSSSRKQS